MSLLSARSWPLRRLSDLTPNLSSHLSGHRRHGPRLRRTRSAARRNVGGESSPSIRSALRASDLLCLTPPRYPQFASGNTFGATAFTAYGAFWLSFGLIYWPSSGILTASYAEGELASALGIYLITWFMFTFLLMLGTLVRTFLSVSREETAVCGRGLHLQRVAGPWSRSLTSLLSPPRLGSSRNPRLASSRSSSSLPSPSSSSPSESSRSRPWSTRPEEEWGWSYVALPLPVFRVASL